jgi:hypothetical protein
MVKAIYCWKHIARRPIGRPKIRWVDDVRKDIQKFFLFFSPMPPHVLLGLCGSPPPAVAVV